MNNKNLTIGLVIAIIIAVCGLFFPQAQALLGRIGTAFPNGISIGAGTVSTAGSLVIGASGSSINELKATTCDLIGTNASHAASTTIAYDCAVTGIASGDVVMAQLATSTARGFGAWGIVGSLASTTSGFVTVILNNSGLAAVPSVSSVGSSTQIWYMDN